MIYNIHGVKFNDRLAQILFGLILGLLIYPPAAQAQFGVAVVADTTWQSIEQLRQATTQTLTQAALVQSSETSRLKQIVEYIKLADNWIKTVEFYTSSIEGDIRRFTSLKGVLGAAEKQLGLNDDTLTAMADIGALIRGSLTLKSNFISLVRTRLSMIESLERRARAGIFDPGADMEDLEQYLRYSIGRESDRTLASRARLAEQDPELERLSYELRKVRFERSGKQKELADSKVLLDAQARLRAKSREVSVDGEGNSQVGAGQSASSEAIATLTARISSIEQQLLTLDALEKELIEKIQKKYGEYHTRFDDNYYEGHQWMDNLRGFRVFSLMKQREMECLIDYYGTNRDCSAQRRGTLYDK